MTKNKVPLSNPKAYIEPAEVDRLINGIPIECLRDKTFICLLAHTGVRVSEALNIRRKHILPDKLLCVYSLKQRGQKQPYRLVPISDTLDELLNKYINYFDICQSARLFPFTRQWADYTIKRWCRVLNVRCVDGSIPHCHTLRHSFAIRVVRSTKMTIEELRKLQVLMGHSSIDTTAYYLNFSPDAYRDVITTSFKSTDE